MELTKKKVTIYSSILCLIIVIVGVILWVSKSRIPQPTYPLNRHIQYSFTLQNRSDRMSKKVVFQTYAPVKQTSTQLCMNLESSHPYQLTTDHLGNQVMHFTFDMIPPYGTKIVKIKADLQLSKSPNPLSQEVPSSYLRPQKYCESDHQEIMEAAKKIDAPEQSKTAESIYTWVTKHVQYSGYLKNAKGALYALKNKKGDCTEFMYLFAALCRASNIPTRCISGYICKKNTVLTPTSYHNWSEFYRDDTWCVSDPQNKVFMKDPANYIAMRIIDDDSDGSAPKFNRFRIEGEGMSAKMN